MNDNSKKNDDKNGRDIITNEEYLNENNNDKNNDSVKDEREDNVSSLNINEDNDIVNDNYVECEKVNEENYIELLCNCFKLKLKLDKSNCLFLRQYYRIGFFLEIKSKNVNNEEKISCGIANLFSGDFERNDHVKFD